MITLIIVVGVIVFGLFMLSGTPIHKASKRLNEEFKYSSPAEEQIPKVDWTKTTEQVKHIFDKEDE